MYKKFFVFLGILTAVYIIWILGLNWVYAYMLKFGVAFFTASAKTIATNIEKLSDGQPEFQLIINGARARIPIEPLILPFVLILAWQIFIFIYFPRKLATKATLLNLSVFYILQVFYLLLFLSQGKYVLLEKLKLIFPNSFTIIAFFFIVKDYFLFMKPQQQINQTK